MVIKLETISYCLCVGFYCQFGAIFWQFVDTRVCHGIWLAKIIRLVICELLHDWLLNCHSKSHVTLYKKVGKVNFPIMHTYVGDFVYFLWKFLKQVFLIKWWNRMKQKIFFSYSRLLKLDLHGGKITCSRVAAATFSRWLLPARNFSWKISVNRSMAAHSRCLLMSGLYIAGTTVLWHFFI